MRMRMLRRMRIVISTSIDMGMDMVAGVGGMSVMIMPQSRDVEGNVLGFIVVVIVIVSTV
ncbi:hypothetical protein BDW66DRAFT_125127 [Aspergillus desertorum]